MPELSDSISGQDFRLAFGAATCLIGSACKNGLNRLARSGLQIPHSQVCSLSCCSSPVCFPSAMPLIAWCILVPAIATSVSFAPLPRGKSMRQRLARCLSVLLRRFFSASHCFDFRLPSRKIAGWLRAALRLAASAFSSFGPSVQ